MGFKHVNKSSDYYIEMITKIYIYLIVKKLYELFCVNLNTLDRRDFFLNNINDREATAIYRK